MDRLQVKNITIDQKPTGRATLWRDDTRGLSAALDRLYTVCRDGLAELIGDYTYGLEHDIAPPPPPSPYKPLSSRPSWTDKP